ncbi:RBBP9/YdeN family alpha/beta hydrolase [Mucilaginibacter agri]|uniref:Alpha/beta hydrolase n=1 Tax=Mucilaginibacter agri TaxID=2695265 RepID=A0A965ZHU6_9SPHI|nr:alpha/beta hydrolase [Mucilaginibacter agri]NCD71359.1 alpha/beta hydrolase [Mucilaginibacter agri]
MHFNSTILIIPGLGNSGEQHWQTIWQNEYNFIRVEQQDWETPVCNDWIENLDAVINQYNPAEVLLVGHSLACNTIANWAKEYKTPIKGSLLVSPSDTEAESYPSGTTGFAPMLLDKLPFPTIVVSSSDDYYVSPSRAEQFAEAWGSEFISIGKAGHINASSGFGKWDEGLEILKALD